MKTLKIYITIALTNAVLFVLIVGGGAQMKTIIARGSPSSPQADVLTSVTPTIAAITTQVPIPHPTRRVMKIIRYVTPTPLSVSASTSTDTQSNVAGVSSITTTTSSTTSAPATNTASSAPTSAPQPTQDSRCLIGIDGSTYDVTAFRSMHSGGNVFTCGADMSAVFWGRHGQSNLNQMAKYKV